MKNKPVIITLIALVLLLGTGFVYNKYFKALSPGILPALKPDSSNNTSSTNPTTGKIQPINSTGIPLKIPNNFSLSTFAKDLGGPRDLIMDPTGTLLASIPSRGQVVALVDSNNDGTADSAPEVITGLSTPHGLAFDGNNLYIAEINKVSLYSYDANSKKATNGKKLFDLPGTGGLTTGSGHVTRSLLIAPINGQNKLFVSIGSSCNVCIEADSRRAAIWFSNLDGSDFRSFATGLRNSVFMDINPVTGKIYATDNGRDRIGDDIPPEEINIIEEGKNYGWPICYGSNIHDTDFDKKTYIQDPCSDKVKPLAQLQAHSAPLGLSFVPEEGWPEDYWYNLIVAYHGSWNRSTPTGFKLARVKLNSKGEYQGVEDFISGWLPGTNTNQAYGRPVDVLLLSGGTGYISDDKAGVVYKLNYLRE